MEIKKIVKSDGTVVDFDSSKLNKWAEYASQNNVDWSSIAVESYRKCFDGCTTMDLQNAMIATCIEKEKDEYMNMAGRLLIGSIYKEVHGGFRSIPTLKEFYHDMVERGFWEKMDYTDEELNELESVINHNINLEYSYTSLHQMRNKYLMKIEGSDICLESPQFMFMGIAMASFELEDKEHRLEDVKKFYKYSSEMKINIATPMLVNLRSPSKGLASCCVYTAGDTIDSLSAGDLIAYHMTANSAGIGSHVNSRSIGDPVKQGRVLHQGKLPYYRMIQSAVHANKQACYDKETEVLTENGFKLFSELEDELIAQVNDDGTMEFVEKEDFFQYDNVEKLHRFDILGKSILVTDNHRMTIIEDEEFNENESPNFDGNNFKEVEAKDLELTENIYFKHGITSNNKYVNNEDVTVNILKYLNRLGKLKSFEIDRSEGQEFNTFLIELNNVVDYFGTKTEIDTIIENIEKRFEGEVFTDLMERCDKKSMFKFKVDTKIDLTLKDEELLKMSSVDAIGILHILQYFVSTEVGSQLVFWKLEKDGVDFVQLIAMLSNLKTTTYFESEDGTETVHIGSSSMTNGKFVLKEEVDYNDTVYCVQVPSGRVVVRRDGLVLVCGNSRGGANTTYFPCIDPEVMDLLVLKNPTTIVSKRIREIDYALSVNRLFVERVAKNGDWYTISRYYAPDLYEAFYSGDYDKFVEMYEKYEDHEKAVKYKAREIATKALVESAETGRIYMHYVDEANRHTPFKETIYSSNLCVAPETKILTDKGNIEISTLTDQKVNVWNGEEWSETIVRKTGENQKLIKVEFSNGETIECTPYHKFYLEGKEEPVEASDLKVDDVLITFELPESKETFEISVVEITDEGRIDNTFCFTESKRNMGVFNGILTGNCNEIALPTKPFSSPADLYSDDPDGEIALCSLSSLVLGRISDEEYEDVAYYAVKFVDNTITIMDYPFPSLKVTANKRRNLGIGMTNLAYHMAKNKKSYATLEGKKFIHEVAEKHAFWVYKASLRLAKEKGVCDWIGRTKFPEGWLPIDTYNKNLDEVVPNDLKMDWEGLRKEMIEVGGLRNSVLIAIAPNESSSQLTNTTNSVYPIRNLRVVKTSGNTKNVLIAPEAKELEHFYDIAWDLSSKDIIELYGICQKFIDQSLSADLYIDFRKSDKISVKNLLTDFVRMMKLGCKGRYYINSNSGITSSELDEPSCEGCTM